MNVLKRVPLPISGVALGSASLGNLLAQYSDVAHALFGITATVLLSLLILKTVVYPETLKEDLKNPITAGVSATFPMAVMVLCTYLNQSFISRTIWTAAVILHLILMVYFLKKFILKMNINDVYTPHFIVYVGIVVAAVTGPTVGMDLIGEIAFYFGFVSLIPLFILISYRYIKHKNYPKPTYPLICIFAAPFSLCITGFINSFGTAHMEFIIGMYVFAVALYIVGFVTAVRTIMMKFYPSYAALTFPMVISATASCLISNAISSQIIDTIFIFETVFATIIVSYVIVRYIMHIADIHVRRSSC